MKRRSVVRWLPAIVAPVVVAGAALAWSIPASAAVTLPAKTPEQVLELAASSTVTQFSGTVTESSDLGLPSIPSGVGSSSTGGIGSLSGDLQSLTGGHTARVFVDGRTRSRIEITDSLAETDVVRNGDSVWIYDSKKNTATHVVLPAGQSAQAPSAGEAPTPSSLADGFLADVAPTTTVALGGNVRVAGRTAYDLVLTPRTSATLVGSVSIAVDAQTGLPLSVQVAAKGQSSPAVDVAFASLSLQAPSSTLFEFTPPAGATVTTKTLGAASGSAAGSTPSTGKVGTARIGSGWSTILELPASSLPAGFGSALDSPLLKELTKQVSDGRAVSTSLVSILLTSDGRVLIGAVPVSALQAAAGS